MPFFYFVVSKFLKVFVPPGYIVGKGFGVVLGDCFMSAGYYYFLYCGCFFVYVSAFIYLRGVLLCAFTKNPNLLFLR